MTPRLSIIIVTWNGIEHLKRFLPSVMATEHDSFEVIIADNASTDGSAEWVGRHYPECRVVRFSVNHGYCGGNNRAVAYARGDLLLFLNNDVSVEPDWLDALIRCFDDPEVAAAQPRIRSWREPDKFEYAGAAGGFLDSMAYPFCRGRVFSHVEIDEGQYDDPVSLFWASGAALAIRKELFHEMGRFDEMFEFHMEEVDLCWRLLNRGYRITCAPDSKVYHLGGGSLDRTDPRKTYYNFRNSLRMIWKNASGRWLRRRFILRLLLDGVAAIHFLFQNNVRAVPAIFRAHLHFYRNWHRIHRQRTKLQAKRIRMEEPGEMVRTSIIIEFYIRGYRTYREIADRLNRKRS